MTCRVLFSIVVVLEAISVQAQTQAPVPGAEAQAKAMAMVVEVYKGEYDAAKTSSQKEALAGKLLQLATTTTETNNRYALLRVTRDLSVEAGGPACFQAVDEMAKAYQIDRLDMKAKVLAACSTNARMSAQATAVANIGTDLINESIAADNYVLAQYLGAPTLAAARKARDRSMSKQVIDLNAKVTTIAKAAAEVEPALTTLDTNPADPAANLAAGKFYCWMKGDWGKGLPMLALGSDVTMKALAGKELQGVSTPKEEAALADGWWALAESEAGTAREQLQAHAAGWYKRAAPKLTGLVKARVEKRLSEAPVLGEVVASSTPAAPAPRPSSVKPRAQALSAGLRGLLFARQPSQQGNDGYLHPSKLGQPVGTPATIGCIRNWKFDASKNAVALGMLRIDEPGVYSFKTYNFYDRNALFLDGNLVCPYRGSVSGGTDPAGKEKILLKKGYVPIMSVGYVDARGSAEVRWKPPGQDQWSAIPTDLLSHDPSFRWPADN